MALELKGAIISRGFTAKAVAEGIGRPAPTLNRWLNAKLPLPLAILCEACEFIDIDPQQIVANAYDRVLVMYGERNGVTYTQEDRDESELDVRRLEESEA